MLFVSWQGFRGYDIKEKDDMDDDLSDIGEDETCKNAVAVILIIITIISVIILFWIQNSKYHITGHQHNLIIQHDKNMI